MKIQYDGITITDELTPDSEIYQKSLNEIRFDELISVIISSSESLPKGTSISLWSRELISRVASIDRDRRDIEGFQRIMGDALRKANRS